MTNVLYTNCSDLYQDQKVQMAQQDRADKQHALDTLQEKAGYHREMIATFKKSLDDLLTTALAHKNQDIFNDHHETDEDILSQKALADLKGRLDEICEYILYQDETYEDMAREEYTEARGTLWDVLKEAQALKAAE